MVTAVCVLRSGGDFLPEHVARLRDMVHGMPFVCLSDVPVDCERIALRHDWPRWWAKMEIFAPWVEGDILYIDLDTTILKMPAMPDRTTVLRDAADDRCIGSGLMFLKAEDRPQVWRDFAADPKRAMESCKYWPNYGDQGFLRRYFTRAQKWQDIARIYSYKLQCQDGVPEDAEIVYFHGKPRPWNLPQPLR